MVQGTARLLATRGLHGASFGEIIEATKVPRGSIYHHFPGGKDELVAEAMGWAGEQAIASLRASDGEPAAAIAARFLELWRHLLVQSDFHAGCSVLAVTVAAEGDPLLKGAATIFATWQAELARLLEHGGLTASDADQFAALLIAASEGAVVMSRAQRSIASFDLVADSVLGQVRDMASRDQAHTPTSASARVASDCRSASPDSASTSPTTISDHDPSNRS